MRTKRSEQGVTWVDAIDGMRMTPSSLISSIGSTGALGAGIGGLLGPADNSLSVNLGRGFLRGSGIGLGTAIGSDLGVQAGNAIFGDTASSVPGLIAALGLGGMALGGYGGLQLSNALIGREDKKQKADENREKHLAEKALKTSAWIQSQPTFGARLGVLAGFLDAGPLTTKTAGELPVVKKKPVVKFKAQGRWRAAKKPEETAAYNSGDTGARSKQSSSDGGIFMNPSATGDNATSVRMMRSRTGNGFASLDSDDEE